MRGVSLITFSLFSLLASPIFSSAEPIIFPPPVSLLSSPIFSSPEPIIFPPPVSSFPYQLKGNVYPRGTFVALIKIGNSPIPYELDIDTGSDFTWIQCDAPCKHCTVPPEKLYKPHNNYVNGSDPLCALIQPKHGTPPKPNDQCIYKLEYADKGTSEGALVQDFMSTGSFKFPVTPPFITFGCGYDQNFSSKTPPSVGVLGLGGGNISIVSQVSSRGFTLGVLGHCLSSKEGGYLFFGNSYIPRGVVWTPIIKGPHYIVGPADLLLGGKPTSVKGLQLTFDTGSTYTYFTTQIYKAILDQVSGNLKRKPLSRSVKDGKLAVCWESSLKPPKRFTSINEVKGFFKPMTLSFTESKNVQFQIPPEYYLIISKKGCVCLGILDAGRINNNIIGDIFMQDKVVIYDNEKQQVGWASDNCNPPH